MNIPAGGYVSGLPTHCPGQSISGFAAGTLAVKPPPGPCPTAWVPKPVVQALLRHRLLTEEEYREMAQTAADEPYFINLILTRRLLGKNDIAFLLRNVLHIPVMNLDAVMFDPRAIEMVPEDICLHGINPVAYDNSPVYSILFCICG